MGMLSVRGSRYRAAISFDTRRFVMDLGLFTMRALSFVDQEIFAPGIQAKTGKHVA